MLIANKPPAVNADTHDHGARRPNTSDATLTHTPIASSASATGDPCDTTASQRPVQRPRPPQEVSGDQLSTRTEPQPPVTHRLRRHPEPLRDPPIPLPAGAAAPRRSPRPRPAGRARHTSGSSTCVASTPARDNDRAAGEAAAPPPASAPPATARSPSLPTRPPPQRGHNNRPAARSASTTARSSATINTTSSNGVTGPLVAHRIKVSARGPQSTGSPPSCRPTAPTATGITTQRDAEPPRRHHPACRSTASDPREYPPGSGPDHAAAHARPTGS